MKLLLSPELVLDAYKQGLFPMAHSGDSHYLHWICPEERALISITDIHIPKRLKKTIRQAPFEIRIDSAFEKVIQACSEPDKGREETWINHQIIDTFMKLHKKGHAHSIECWDADNNLVGGLYGLAIGGAFFGESMYSRARDASKVALIHLCARLWKGNFSLLDTQFVNDHLKQFGVFTIPHDAYMKRLTRATSAKNANFFCKNIPEDKLIQDYFAMRAMSQHSN